MGFGQNLRSFPKVMVGKITRQRKAAATRNMELFMVYGGKEERKCINKSKARLYTLIYTENDRLKVSQIY